MRPRRWRITKERVYDRDNGRWTHHRAWHLYRGGRGIARYRSWQQCIDHIQAVYRKWPDFDKGVVA